MADDLYGDLDTSIGALEKKEAIDLKRKAEQENAALRRELTLLQTQNRQLGQRNQVLEVNVSTLFATAQNEIRRKDKEIQRLRDALDAQERRPRNDAARAHRGGTGSGSYSASSSKSPSHSRHSSLERRA
uniref:Uncharacterized protein n=1 Tax=Globisporangium ultimum (strain ATCC 200006 / CBS 805.95 / DAOM BR144) TaxID=431595 RepID=K3WRB7_GLOUD